MKCPHCLESFHELLLRAPLTDLAGTWAPDVDGHWAAFHTDCPACRRKTIFLISTGVVDSRVETNRIMAWPKGFARSPLATEIPEPFAADYREACTVLTDSTKASAALSRRCLQRLLREKAGAKPTNLYTEIGEVIPKLPSHLAEAIDAVRNVGLFAAHPNKSTNSGEVIDVEPGEAEWNLEVLEGLFDFYFVQPARLAAMKEALNKKLADAGRPPMK